MFKFLDLLDKSEKIKFFSIFFLLLIASFLEVLSIGAIVPLVENLVSNKNTQFIESIINKYSLNLFSENFTINIVIIVFLIFIFKNLFLFFLIWYRSKFVIYLRAKWQAKLLQIYLNQNFIFHSKKNSSILIRNIQQEINQALNSYLSPFLEFCLNMLIIILIVISLLFIYPTTTIIVVLFFGSSAFFINFFVKKIVYRIGEIRQETSLKMLQHMQESFSNILYVKLMRLENFFLNLFNPHNFKIAKFGVKRVLYGAAPKLIFEILFIATVSFYILFVIKSGGSKDLLFSKLIIFVIASLKIIPALNSITNNYQKFRFGLPALDLVYKELTNLNFKPTKKKLERINLETDIQIKNVSFKFDNKKNLFNNLNFIIEKSKINGIIGPNGSGKTTLVNIISGLIKPNEGLIEINNKNIMEILPNWQNLIGFIPQDIYLIDNTIEANIALGVEESQIDKEKIKYVMNLTELSKDFSANYIIGEQGKVLSGGQRQKIAISRAFYNNPEILIFDEPTSALDNDAEKNFIDNFINKTNKTIILISHRKEPLMYCSNLFELSEGKIIKLK